MHTFCSWGEWSQVGPQRWSGLFNWCYKLQQYKFVCFREPANVLGPQAAACLVAKSTSATVQPVNVYPHSCRLKLVLIPFDLITSYSQRTKDSSSFLGCNHPCCWEVVVLVLCWPLEIVFLLDFYSPPLHLLLFSLSFHRFWSPTGRSGSGVFSHQQYSRRCRPKGKNSGETISSLLPSQNSHSHPPHQTFHLLVPQRYSR